MARSWAELLGDEDASSRGEGDGPGFFGRLRDSLGKSRRALTEQLALRASILRMKRPGNGSRRR